jgi:hypothetical protein
MMGTNDTGAQLIPWGFPETASLIYVFFFGAKQDAFFLTNSQNSKVPFYLKSIPKRPVCRYHAALLKFQCF